MVIVDGFCGGGLYRKEDGSPHHGSPLIIVEALKQSLIEIIEQRTRHNIKAPFGIKCDLYFVDKDPSAIEVLKEVLIPELSHDTGLPLEICTHYINAGFQDIYKDITNKINKNTKSIFILDPFGYSEVPLPIIKDIMHGGGKREVIWTFMIEALLTYGTEESTGLINAGYDGILSLFKKDEKPTGFSLQTEIFKTIHKNVGVPFFTPFAIKQKKGWDYWLIHMAWHHRASEVMKEVEHRHADQREHYGGSGLHMMAAEGDSPYLFTTDDEARGRNTLEEQLPQLLSTKPFEGGISFDSFMKTTYNETPLRAQIIKETIIEHPDIDILTPNNRPRSSVHTIVAQDTIMLKRQKRFILEFPQE